MNRTSEETGNAPLGVSLVVAVVILAVFLGGFLSHRLAADQKGQQSCSPIEKLANKDRPISNRVWSELSLVSSPPSPSLNFGYGRGSDVLTEVLTFAPTSRSPRGHRLPSQFVPYVSPITQVGGNADLPGAVAIATRLPHSSYYQVTICVRTLVASPAGHYSGDIGLPEQKALLLTTYSVNLQSTKVPNVLWVYGPICVLLGIMYTILLFTYKRMPKVTVGGLALEVLGEIWTPGGIVAIITGSGAMYGVWLAQAGRNPSWQGNASGMLITLAAMTVAAAGAASVPLGFSRPSKGRSQDSS